MMRFNFAYVAPKLCQVHSNVQMKIFPVSISTQSRNSMSNGGKTTWDYVVSPAHATAMLQGNPAGL